MNALISIASLTILGFSQICLAAPVDLSKPLTTAREVGVIPREDSPNDKEVKDFEKNWKGKTISITGKVNRGGGISVDEFYVDGCKEVLKQAKPGATATVTGVLTSRYSGGSGGEPVVLSNCRLGGATSPTVMPNIAQPSSVVSAKDQGVNGTSFVEQAVGQIYSSGSIQLTVDKKLSKVKKGQIGVCFGDVEPVIMKINGNEALSPKNFACQFTLRFIDERTIEVNALSQFCEETGVAAGKTKTFLLKKAKYHGCQIYND